MNTGNNYTGTGGTCYYHSDRAFVGQCNKCRKFLCRPCWAENNGICADCAVEIADERKRIAKSDIKFFKTGAIIGFICAIVMGSVSIAVNVVTYGIEQTVTDVMGQVPSWLPTVALIPLGIIIGLVFCTVSSYMAGSIILGYKVVFRRIRKGGAIMIILAIILVFITYMSGAMIGLFGSPFILYKARKILKEDDYIQP